MSEDDGSERGIDILTWNTVETEVRKIVMDLVSPVSMQSKNLTLIKHKRYFLTSR
jgi:hypothetical protein